MYFEKMAHLIQMPNGTVSQVAPKDGVLDGSQISHVKGQMLGDIEWHNVNDVASSQISLGFLIIICSVNEYMFHCRRLAKARANFYEAEAKKVKPGR